MATINHLLVLLCSAGMCVSDTGIPLLTNNFPHLKHQISLFSTALGYSYLALWKRQELIWRVQSLTWLKWCLLSNTFPFCGLSLYWLFHQNRYKCIFLLATVWWNRRFTSLAVLLNGAAGHCPINVICKTHGSDCIRQYDSQRHPGCLLKAWERMKNSIEGETLSR